MNKYGQGCCSTSCLGRMAESWVERQLWPQRWSLRAFVPVYTLIQNKIITPHQQIWPSGSLPPWQNFFWWLPEYHTLLSFPVAFSHLLIDTFAGSSSSQLLVFSFFKIVFVFKGVDFLLIVSILSIFFLLWSMLLVSHLRNLCLMHDHTDFFQCCLQDILYLSI